MRIENPVLIQKWEVYESKTKPGTYPPKLEAYMPTKNDVPTIGWGHTKGVKMGQTVTYAQAEALFWEDVEWVERAVNRLVKVDLTQNQFDALCSLVFNIGAGAFAGSTVLRRVNQKDFEGAAKAFLMWNKQTNKRTGKKEVLQGLVRRRKEEAEYFLSEGFVNPETKPDLFSSLRSFLNKILKRYNIKGLDNG
jgi:lysozyme